MEGGNTWYRLARKAQRWAKLNPESWHLMARYTREMSMHARPFSINIVLSRVRWDCALMGKRLRMDNTLAPYIARKLRKEYPLCRDYLMLQEYYYDKQCLENGTGIYEVFQPINIQ